MSSQSARTLEIDGRTVQVLEAWRAPSGLGLAYFVVENAEELDRRSVLEVGEELAVMPDDVLEVRWAGAARLTPTERRLVDRESRLWLVQGLGPVWAEGGTAADAVGMRVRCLSEALPSLDLTGVRPDQISNAELLEALAGHLRPPDAV